MRNKLVASLTCLVALVWLIPCYAGDVEIYRTDEGAQSKIIYYHKNTKESAAQFLAQKGYAGKRMWFEGEISEDEYQNLRKLKREVLKRLGLTEEEFNALVKS